MRIGIMPCTAALLLALPAAAASVDPSRLVLRPADVPAGFAVDRAATRALPNARETRENPILARPFERFGRVTGYQASYERGSALIQARVDVFRRADGARGFALWYDREVRKLGLADLRRSRARIGGGGGWVYRATRPTPATSVVWSQGRVFSGVFGEGDPASRALALARAQERRITAGLRR